MTSVWHSYPGRGLHGQIVESLGQAIVNGEYAEGQLIPTDKLAEQYGVSRSVIRETLRVLESLGMLRARPKVGTWVLPTAMWSLMHPLVIVWRGRSPMYLDQLRELLQLRSGVEPVAARYAATLAGPDVIAEMDDCVSRMEQAAAARQRGPYLEADTRYHELLLRNCGNHLIEQFVDTVAAVLRTRQEERHQMFTPATVRAVANHRTLVEALGSADPVAAERAARIIVDDTLAELVEGTGVPAPSVPAG